MEKRWITVDGQRLFYRCATGQPRQDRIAVVFVHGLGVSSRYFVPVMDRLAGVCDVYAPDLPGHGRSPGKTRPLTIEALAQVLLDWLSAMQLERVVLVGQSLGCQVAAEAALRQPERIERLALVGPTLDPEQRRLRVLLPRFVADIPLERLSLIPLVAWDYLRMGWRALPEFQAMFAYHLEDKMSSINQPVLLVRGEFDPVAPRRWLDEAARRHGTAQVKEIAGWGHSIHFDAPECLADVLQAFFGANRH